MNLPIYMDYHATTPADPRVVDAMLPYFTERFGNPASRSHVFGWKAEEAVETARAQLAALIGATPKEIVFTSGATESDNLAIAGVARALREKGDHIVTCATEHRAVLDTCRALEADGFRVTVLPVSRTGRVEPDQVRRALTDRTILVSIMFANNEVGTIQPVAEIGRIAHEAGVLYHSDGVQAIGKVPVDVIAQGIDLLSMSAHKMYGPKGVGALYVRRRNPRVRLAPLTHGGGQENGLRSGTLNVTGIVGFGAAAEVAQREMAEEAARLTQLRDRLERAIFDGLDDVLLNGDREHRLPGNLNVSFGGVQGESLLLSMRDVAVSSGSACTSTSVEASHVLSALGLTEAQAQASIRYGLGRFTTKEEVDYVGRLTVETVRKLRAALPAGRAPVAPAAAG